MSSVCKLLVITLYLEVLLHGRIHCYVIYHILTATKLCPLICLLWPDAWSVPRGLGSRPNWVLDKTLYSPHASLHPGE